MCFIMCCYRSALYRLCEDKHVYNCHEDSLILQPKALAALLHIHALPCLDLVDENSYYITVRVKPAFSLPLSFERTPHLLSVCSKVRPISTKTVKYQNNHVIDAFSSLMICYEISVGFFLRLELIISYNVVGCCFLAQ